MKVTLDTPRAPGGSNPTSDAHSGHNDYLFTPHAMKDTSSSSSSSSPNRDAYSTSASAPSIGGQHSLPTRASQFAAAFGVDTAVMAAGAHAPSSTHPPGGMRPPHILPHVGGGSAIHVTAASLSPTSTSSTGASHGPSPASLAASRPAPLLPDSVNGTALPPPYAALRSPPQPPHQHFSSSSSSSSSVVSTPSSTTITAPSPPASASSTLCSLPSPHSAVLTSAAVPTPTASAIGNTNYSSLTAIQGPVSPSRKKTSTPLHYACRFGHLQVVRTILDSALESGGEELEHVETDLVAADWKQMTPVHVAAKHGQAAVVELLVRFVLHRAAYWVEPAAGPPRHHRLQLEWMRAVLDAQCGEGATALMLAAQHGHAACVRHLLAAGSAVDPTRRTASRGWTAATFAARYGHTAVLRELARAGGIGEPLPTWSVSMGSGSGNPDGEERWRASDILDTPDVRDGNTPLMIAAKYGKVEAVRELLRAVHSQQAVGKPPPVSVEAVNANGQSAVHLAAQHGHNAVVSDLLRNNLSMRQQAAVQMAAGGVPPDDRVPRSRARGLAPSQLYVGEDVRRPLPMPDGTGVQALHAVEGVAATAKHAPSVPSPSWSVWSAPSISPLSPPRSAHPAPPFSHRGRREHGAHRPSPRATPSHLQRGPPSAAPPGMVYGGGGGRAYHTAPPTAAPAAATRRGEDGPWDEWISHLVDS
ncbi:hypothetical protein CDCA_CDCA12G3363 [Cyanidium caldarium]|uniref:Ankyrin repeat protein n=1 Tax=Cyanidium caldarium TaxID=2771 RepID=A0AAV9IZ20_CYACA|nr:hypothetical protein CDCA_CDCA12G3363 [Cyanidium caldarium]